MKTIHIAVVDDNLAQNKLTVKKLKQMSKLNKLEEVKIATQPYFNGMDFLHSERVYDLIIMDYDMPVMNGIEVAEELVKRGARSKIIFLSGYDDIVRPLQKSTSNRLTVGFVFKSDPPEELQHHVVNAIEDILGVHFILVKHYEEIENIGTRKYKKQFYEIIVDAKKIVTIETRNKQTFIYLKDDSEFLTATSLNEWPPKLPIGDFSYANQRHLINFRYVDSISRREVKLIDGETIRLTDTYAKAFKDKWHTYKEKKAVN